MQRRHLVGVQLLQLLHAHEVPALHNTSTLECLDAIAEAGLVPALVGGPARGDGDRVQLTPGPGQLVGGLATDQHQRVAGPGVS
ncbi:hypothetical protein JHV675_52140 [Mycobacterium avium subsp. hominissuis]